MSAMDGSRVLVTGGTGFIGSALVRLLREKDCYVRVFDNNFRGSGKNLRDVSGIEVVEGDIRSPREVKPVVKGIDTVFHLAFINGTENFYRIPELVLDVGIRGQLNMLDAVAESDVKTFVYASSSEVYQTPEKVPTDESVACSIPDVKNPRYSYAAGKLTGEVLTLHYLKGRPVRRVIFRPHNIYGPAMGFEHVIPQIVRKIGASSNGFRKDTCRIEIQGDGSETRAFCFIEDAVKGIVLAAEAGDDGAIYNVGVSNEITIRSLIQEIAAILGIDVEVVPGPEAAGGTKRRCPDVARLSGLGYRPSVDPARGLEATVQWYREHFLTQRLSGEGALP